MRAADLLIPLAIAMILIPLLGMAFMGGGWPGVLVMAGILSTMGGLGILTALNKI